MRDCSNPLKPEPTLSGVHQTSGERRPLIEQEGTSKENEACTSCVFILLFIACNTSAPRHLRWESRFSWQAARFRTLLACWAMQSHRQHWSWVALPLKRYIPGCAECLAVCLSHALWQLLPILAADSWWPGDYVVGLRAWRSVSASLSFILLAPYIISNIFKEHSLNDGAYNSISGVLMTRAWFLWFMMSPGPIDGVVAP